MKRLIICFFLIIQLGYTQKKSDSIPSNKINTFQEGEWFQLRLHYGPFNASYATLSLERDTIKGKPVFHAKGFGETTGIARWFFKVEDYYESYFDEKIIYPYKFIRDINEGGYTKDVEIEFDHQNGTALVNNKKKGEINEFSVESGVQDLISSFYYLRNFFPKDKLKKNESFNINMFFDNENYLFKLKYLGNEVINSKFGKINCLKFRPIVQSGRVFEEQEFDFGCGCSIDKVKQTMSIYSMKEIEVMTNDLGKVTADCQFCGTQYILSPSELVKNV